MFYNAVQSGCAQAVMPMRQFGDAWRMEGVDLHDDRLRNSSMNSGAARQGSFNIRFCSMPPKRSRLRRKSTQELW